jgi:hypothetical protein
LYPDPLPYHLRQFKKPRCFKAKQRQKFFRIKRAVRHTLSVVKPGVVHGVRLFGTVQEPSVSVVVLFGFHGLFFRALLFGFGLSPFNRESTRSKAPPWEWSSEGTTRGPQRSRAKKGEGEKPVAEKKDLKTK